MLPFGNRLSCFGLKDQNAIKITQFVENSALDHKAFIDDDGPEPATPPWQGGVTRWEPSAFGALTESDPLMTGFLNPTPSTTERHIQRILGCLGTGLEPSTFSVTG